MILHGKNLASQVYLPYDTAKVARPWRSLAKNRNKNPLNNKDNSNQVRIITAITIIISTSGKIFVLDRELTLLIT
jgi:hypothetical protein